MITESDGHLDISSSHIQILQELSRPRHCLSTKKTFYGGCALHTASGSMR